MPESEGKHFLMITFRGHQGIFCEASGGKGNPFSKDDEPHTNEEMWEILRGYTFIFNAESVYLTKEEVAEYTSFVSLAEFGGRYGAVLKEMPR